MECFLDWQDEKELPKVIAAIISDFEEDAILDNAILHCAIYYTSHYEGFAGVVFERDGKLYEVNGGHCSCHGLEGQWEPEETSWKAIAMRQSDLGNYAREKLKGND